MKSDQRRDREIRELWRRRPRDRFLRWTSAALIALIAVTVIGSDLIRSLFERPPGDMETELGTLRLEDKLYDQAMAYYEGRDYCIPDDIKRLVLPVLCHRVIVSSKYSTPHKRSEEAETILTEILRAIDVPL